MRSPRVFFHRYISWVLVAVSLVTIIFGYALSGGVLPDSAILSYLHRVFEILFIGLLVTHLVYTFRHFKLNLRETANKIGWGRKNSLFTLRIVQRASSWVIVLASTLCLVMFGVFEAYGVFFKPLIEDFGWSRTVTSSVFSLYAVTHTFSGIIMGRLSDRYGSRRVIILGGLLGGFGILLSSRASSIFDLYIFWGILGCFCVHNFARKDYARILQVCCYVFRESFHSCPRFWHPAGFGVLFYPALVLQGKY